MVVEHLSFTRVISSINNAFVAGIIDEKLTESINSMSFDTTAYNIGVNIGKCILLEKNLNKPSQVRMLFSILTPHIGVYF